MRNLYKTFLYVCCATLLTACGDELEELGYTPTAINDNSHTANINTPTTSDEGSGGTTEDLSGTLADRLNDSYTGMLQVTVNGESSTPVQQTILIEKVDATHIHFRLKNFLLVNGEDQLPVGTILLENIELTPAGNQVSFQINEDVYIQAGDPAITEEWMGPMLGAVPVQLQGTGNQQDMDIDINIDMVSLGQIIHVDFLTEGVTQP